jgi:hypothetical protein
MILYTPLALEDIFPPSPNEPAVIAVTLAGRLCLARQEADGRWVIERLLSTDPADYLDARFQPHTVLHLTPE